MSEGNNAVFLSYASQDAAAAARICAALRASGIEVWFDQTELRGGDAWDASIRKQIKACHLFIPVISQNTHARREGYFRLEWKLAVDRSHLIASSVPFLVPVVIDDTNETDERVPDRFRELQWTRLPDGVSPAEFAEQVKHLMSSDAATSPILQDRLGPQPARGANSDAARATGRVRNSIGLAAGGLLMAALLVAIGYLAVDKYIGPTRGAPPITALPIRKSESKPMPEKSIAVLPFVDMSEHQDQEYFADGLSEELIDHLANSPDLKVIARTSSF